ncbi:hypothetical protein D0X02_23840 [Escherichia coli]|nr:hypothetical protein [Escherichia coli]EEV6211642.1 hypothetical protein [Escherichia coli]EEV8731871.1 hypothetical protein [Escherichia coli]EEW0654675.1 hypothetical protein [Escherichia coli]EEY5527541.1 hypothetical protein [Escherichia coli]
MYLKIRDKLGYMSNSSSNFEMTGTLLGQELRKRNYHTQYFNACRLLSRSGLQHPIRVTSVS